MKVDFNDVMKVLNNNGIDEKYFEDIGRERNLNG
jgi:hypothetical protein